MITCIPSGFKLLNAPIVHLNGLNLTFVNSYKYLGVFILSSFMDDDDISRQVRLLYIRANFLFRKFAYCSGEVKIKLFKSFCTNLYCCHLWSNFKLSSYNKIRVAYNNCFRRLFSLSRRCSASAMFVTFSVLSFGELMRKCVHNFISRIQNCTNIYVKNIHDCTYTDSDQCRRWKTILY